MVKQIEFIEEISKLKNENPDHEIHFTMDSDMKDDGHRWVSGEIVSIKLGCWLETDWGIKTSIDDIEEYFWENDEIYDEYFEGPYPELEKLLSQAQPAIIVNVS